MRRYRAGGELAIFSTTPTTPAILRGESCSHGVSLADRCEKCSSHPFNQDQDEWDDDDEEEDEEEEADEDEPGTEPGWDDEEDGDEPGWNDDDDDA